MADGLDTTAWMGTSNTVTAEYLDTSQSTFFLWFLPQQNGWFRWPGIPWVCRVSRVHGVHQKSEVLCEKLPPAYPRWWAVRAPHIFFLSVLLIQLPTFSFHRMEFNALSGRTFGPSAVNLLPLLTIRCLHSPSKPTESFVSPWEVL